MQNSDRGLRGHAESSVVVVPEFDTWEQRSASSATAAELHLWWNARGD